MPTKERRGRGRPRTVDPVETGMVGFRLPIRDRNRLDRFLLQRSHEGLPFSSKQDIFAWLVERILDGRVTLPKRVPKVGDKAA